MVAFLRIYAVVRKAYCDDGYDNVDLRLLHPAYDLAPGTRIVI